MGFRACNDHSRGGGALGLNGCDCGLAIGGGGGGGKVECRGQQHRKIVGRDVFCHTFVLYKRGRTASDFALVL